MTRAGRPLGHGGRRFLALVVVASLGSLCVALPAGAEPTSRDQLVERDDGSVLISRRAQETVNVPAEPASIDELDFVDPGRHLATEQRPPARRFPACPPPAQRPTTPQAAGEPHGCSRWVTPTTPTTPDDEPDDDPDHPAAITRRAAAALLAHPGTITTLPTRTITGLETYYWLDGTGRRATTRTQAGLTLHLQATPIAYQWAFGDGTISHGGPGTSGPPGASQIRHTYRRSATYQVSALVTWRVTFGLNGVTTQLPDAFTTTATTDLPVDQLRTRLTH